MKTNFNTIKKLKELGVSHFKDMSMEVSFHPTEIQPQVKKQINKSNLKSETIKSVEDEILEMTKNIHIPVLNETV